MRGFYRHVFCAAIFAWTSSSAPALAVPESAGTAVFVETLADITVELSRLEGHAVTLLDHAHELRDGHEVICGIYGATEGRLGPANRKPFGWVDGKLVMSWGPEVNPATRCLQENYGMPLV
ncbi:hypothetical protein JKL49_16450 [Phenylobacterium sp. 20VBR1]|uniref:DUF2155 domain-containing protein n=1 Tax=Phenylobacterium glaciei TaxID=2803784 RepID=A0A941HXD7_9CAUL|nr:hypothetical protein [Phenylobacterium glaciei]MBR7620986.1 hypothetical protein [Phenylobacterium glaciei]